MERLNPDIIREIVTRLPNKDFKLMLQCRKVCRIIRSVLGKPKTGMLFLYFPKYCRRVEFYYRDQESHEMVYLNVNEENQSFYRTVTNIGDMGFTGWDFCLLGSCNGLICYKILEQLGNFIYISNSITGEHIRLPQAGAYYHLAGFGYCHSTNEYKIVSIYNARVQVYTLGDGRGWRDKPDIIYRASKSGVFANGALHWLVDSTFVKIQAFDLTDETFRDLPSPPCYVPPNSYLDVTLQGDVCLCLPYEIKRRKPMMDIWVFNEKNIDNSLGCTERTFFDSSPWIKVFSSRWDSDLTHKLQLLSLTQNEILLWHGVFSCYDAGTFKKLWSAKGEPGVGYVQATHHMNSLVSLKDLGEELVNC